MYQANTWSRARRVILVIKPRPEEIFDRVHFLVTNLELSDYSGEEIANSYSQRGKAELHQGEMKAACKFAFSSSSRKKSHYRGRELAMIEESVAILLSAAINAKPIMSGACYDRGKRCYRR